jgi:hypothetical protein
MRSSFLRTAVLAAVALPLAFSACTTLGPDDRALLEQSVSAAEAARADAQKAAASAERSARAAEAAAASAKQAAEKADRIHRQSLRK